LLFATLFLYLITDKKEITNVIINSNKRIEGKDEENNFYNQIVTL